MNAEQLRRDVEAVPEMELWAYAVVRRLNDAARLIALPILEQDPELVERIAGALYYSPLKDLDPWHRAQVMAVLAALIPTEGE